MQYVSIKVELNLVQNFKHKQQNKWKKQRIETTKKKTKVKTNYD